MTPLVQRKSCGLAQEKGQSNVRKHCSCLSILNTPERTADKIITIVKLVSTTYWGFPKCEKLCINYFSSLLNFVRQVGLFLFYPWENWGSEKLNGSSPVVGPGNKHNLSHSEANASFKISYYHKHFSYLDAHQIQGHDYLWLRRQKERWSFSYDLSVMFYFLKCNDIKHTWHNVSV